HARPLRKVEPFVGGSDLRRRRAPSLRAPQGPPARGLTVAQDPLLAAFVLVGPLAPPARAQGAVPPRRRGRDGGRVRAPPAGGRDRRRVGRADGERRLRRRLRAAVAGQRLPQGGGAGARAWEPLA